jgi:hypothetical protein
MVQEVHVQPAEDRPAPAAQDALVIDIVFGVVSKTLVTMTDVVRPVLTLSGPLARVVLRPSILPARLQPATFLGRAARRGAGYRGEVLVEVEDLLGRLIPAVVSEVLDHVDLTRLVHENVDVVTLAQEVIAEVDLPSIIRDSTGAVASDTLRGVRMQSISGDEAVGRAVARLRLRLGHRTTPPGAQARPT